MTNRARYAQDTRKRIGLNKQGLGAESAGPPPSARLLAEPRLRRGVLEEVDPRTVYLVLYAVAALRYFNSLIMSITRS